MHFFGWTGEQNTAGPRAKLKPGDATDSCPRSSFSAHPEVGEHCQVEKQEAIVLCVVLGLLAEPVEVIRQRPPVRMTVGLSP